MQTTRYIGRLPIIKVRNKLTDEIHIVGSEPCDKLIVDDKGRIRYLNSITGNKSGKKSVYEFVSDEYYTEISMVDPIDYALSELAKKLNKARNYGKKEKS